jgi:hypothetical protein
MKRKTSRISRRHSAHRRLPVVVYSPRIAWFGFLKTLASLAKITAALAILAGIAWCVREGWTHAFQQNPEFRLKAIDLNPNPILDEAGLAEVSALNLTASIFEIDARTIEQRLRSLPGVIHATAERSLPGTLRVRITPRQPRAWISAHRPTTRLPGQLLLDDTLVAYPCPERQWDLARHLPAIYLSTPPELEANGSSKPLRSPELRHCLRLLDAASTFDPEAPRWIDSLRQANEWSLEMITRDGMSATFSLSDHPRQLENLRAALAHARRSGYEIATINLIPRENIPITTRNAEDAPRAIPVEEPTPAPRVAEQRREADLRSLLGRD